MRLLGKKGQTLNNLQIAVMAFAGITITLAIVLYVIANLQTATVTVRQGCGSPSNSTNTAIVYDNCTATNGNQAYIASGSMIDKLATVPTWIGILVVVVFASAVMAYFYFKSE